MFFFPIVVAGLLFKGGRGSAKDGAGLSENTAAL